jgi:hypothetical protein
MENITVEMKARRLRWLAHVERREETAWIRKVRQLDCGRRRRRRKTEDNVGKCRGIGPARMAADKG